MNRPLLLSAAAYTTAITAANYVTARYGTVPVGFGYDALAGTYAAGFALLARDYVHRYGGTRTALTAVAAGAALSFLLATPALAVASALAFTFAEVVDLLVFRPARARYGFVAGAAASNVVSAPVDTFAFLLLAGYPLTAPVVVGQIVGKILWATLAPLAAWSAATGEPLTPRKAVPA